MYGCCRVFYYRTYIYEHIEKCPSNLFTFICRGILESKLRHRTQAPGSAEEECSAS